MDKLIAAFSDQIQEAIEIGRDATFRPSSSEIRNVVITGLGGSGIGGKIVAQLIAHETHVPIAVNNNYFLPTYVDSHTLVIVSSYSGNTEETVHAMTEAMKKRAHVVCITSGGQVLEACEKFHLSHVVIPGGSPPRAALAYSLVQQLFVLKHYNIVADSFIDDLAEAARTLKSSEHEIKEEAQRIASKLTGKLPVIYCDAYRESIAIRWRQQFNENAKVLCWHNVFPELNHNELVGWEQAPKDLAVILLRADADYERIQKRMDISMDIIKDKTDTIIEVHAQGNSSIGRAIYLLHLGDWVSYYLCLNNKQDPMAIIAIDRLKSELAKF